MNEPTSPPPEAALVAVALLNATLTAQIGAMLQLAVPADQMMNVLCEHLGKILALVDPPQLRNQILAEIRRNLPAVVNRHVEARLTTPGGIFVPPEGMRVPN